MALADKLRTKTKEVIASQEEEKYGAIRNKIGDLETKKQQLEEVLGELDAETKVRNAIAKKVRGARNIVFGAMKENAPALSELGIKTKRDITQHSETKDEPESQALLAAEQEVPAAQDEKAEKLKAISKMFPGMFNGGKPVNRRDAVEVIKSELEGLPEQIEQLKLQTPEGREEVKNQMRKEIAEFAARGMRQRPVSADRFSLTSGYLPDQKRDVSFSLSELNDLIAEHGLPLVEEVVREEISKAVDKEFEEKAKQAGFADLRKDFTTFENLDRDNQQARAVWEKVKEKRKDVLKYLEKVFSTAEGAYAVNNYLSRSFQMDGREAASKYLHHEDVELGSAPDGFDYLSRLLESLGTKYDVSGQLQSRQGRYQGTFETKIANPMAIIKGAAALEAKYDNILRTLEPVNLVGFDSHRKLQDKDLVDAASKTSRNIVVSETTAKIFRDSHFSYDRSLGAYKERLKDFEKKVQAAKDLGFNHLEYALASKAWSDFHGPNRDAIERGQKHEEDEKQIKAAELKLQQLEVRLADLKDTKIRIEGARRMYLNAGKNFQISYPHFEEELEKYNNEQKQLELELGQNEYALQQNKRIERGPISNFRGKLDKEKNELEQRTEQSKVKLQEVKEKIQEIVNAKSKIYPIVELLEAANSGRAMIGETTVGKALIRIRDTYQQKKEAIDRDDIKTYRQHKSLKGKSDELWEKVSH